MRQVFLQGNQQQPMRNTSTIKISAPSRLVRQLMSEGGGRKEEWTGKLTKYDYCINIFIYTFDTLEVSSERRPTMYLKVIQSLQLEGENNMLSPWHSSHSGQKQRAGFSPPPSSLPPPSPSYFTKLIFPFSSLVEYKLG